MAPSVRIAGASSRAITLRSVDGTRPVSARASPCPRRRLDEPLAQALADVVMPARSASMQGLSDGGARRRHPLQVLPGDGGAGALALPFRLLFPQPFERVFRHLVPGLAVFEQMLDHLGDCGADAVRLVAAQ